MSMEMEVMGFPGKGYTNSVLLYG